MSENPTVPPPLPSPKFRRLAHFSWLSYVFIFGVAMVVSQLLTQDWQYLVFGCFICLMTGTGIISAIAALWAIPRHGRKGLLWPASIGLLLWLVSFVLLVRSTAEMRRIREKTVLGPFVITPGANRVFDSEAAFSFELPSGYQEIAPESRPEYHRAFVREVSGEGRWGIMITLLPKPLHEGLFRPGDVPPEKKNITVAYYQWRGLQISGVRITEYRTPAVVSYLANIPLKQRGITLTVAGPTHRESDIRAQIDRVLSTIDGETNW